MGLSKAVFILTGCILFLNTNAIAAYDPRMVFGKFAQDLNSRRFSTVYVPQAIQSLRSVEFKNLNGQGMASAINYVNQDKIVLDLSLFNNSTGQIKPIDILGYGDTSIILHELWHSYYWNFVKNSNTVFEQIFKRNYSTLYQKYPSNRREEIHDEAYGIFIQYTLRSYLYFQHMMQIYSSEKRKALRDDPKIRANYENEFRGSVKGYYRTFWGTLVNVDVGITAEDRKLIMTYIYGSQIHGDFLKDFPESIYP